MKKETKTKISMVLLAIMLMVLGAAVTATTASAKKMGDGYQIIGYNAGYVILAIAFVITVLFATKILKMPKAIGIKPIAFFVAILFALGLAMSFVDVPTPTASVKTLSNIEFKVEASAATTDGLWYPDTEYIESSGTFIVPYHANTTSNTLYEHGDNSSYSDDPQLNFTITCDFDPDTMDGDDRAKIYFEITNPSEYVGSDPDHYVLTKTDEVHQAVWTDQDDATSTVYGWTSGAVEDALTLTLDLDLYEAGLSQASVFADISELNIKIYNPSETDVKTFTVQFQCTDTFI